MVATAKTRKGKQNEELRRRECEPEFKKKVLEFKRGGDTPADARRRALEIYLPDWIGGEPPRDDDDAKSAEPAKAAATSTPSARTPDPESYSLPPVLPEYYAGKKASKLSSDLKWVYEHIAYKIEHVDPATAPSAGAYGLLLWSFINRKEFYALWAKLLPKNAALDVSDAETLEEDGKVQVKFIEEVQKYSTKAKGDDDAWQRERNTGEREPDDDAVGTEAGESGVAADNDQLQAGTRHAGGPRVLTADELAELSSDRARAISEGAGRVERVGDPDEGGSPVDGGVGSAEPDTADVDPDSVVW